MACETFCLDDDDTFLDATRELASEALTVSNTRFHETEKVDLVTSLANCHSRNVSVCKLLKKSNPHGEHSTSRATLLIQLESDLHYLPGDHVGVFPCNRSNIVEGVLKRLQGVADFDTTLELQVLKESHTPNG